MVYKKLYILYNILSHAIPIYIYIQNIEINKNIQNYRFIYLYSDI